MKTDGPSGQPRYKARLVVKGFSQRKGIDYEEIFSYFMKMTSICAVLAMAAQQDLKIEQMDIKMTFLHKSLEEEIYMEQSEGFAQTGQKDLVCRLRKSLYASSRPHGNGISASTPPSRRWATSATLKIIVSTSMW